MRKLVVLLVLGLSLLGCAVPIGHDVAVKHPIRIVLHTDWYKFINCVDMWDKEISRKYKLEECVIVYCHGFNFMGDWWLWEDVPMTTLRLTNDELKRIHLEFPNRRIIVMACNPGHYTLDIPHLVYPIDSVWFTPDANMYRFNLKWYKGWSNIWIHHLFGKRYKPFLDNPRGEDGVGSIFEFVENK